MALQKSSVLFSVHLCSLLILIKVPGHGQGHQGVLGAISEIPPPAAAVFLREPPSVNRLLLNDIVNSDVEIEPGRSVELECYANNPVQWNYGGSGRPQFTTNITVDVLNSREVYKASLLISNANELNTGTYVCSYAEFPRVSSSYHLFVPGPEIFVSDSGRSIGYSPGMSSVTIPCPVTVKNAKVTLRKVYYDDSLRSVDPAIAKYDPKTGFKLNIRDVRDAEGTYVCTGYVNGTLRLREYNLRNEQRNQTLVTFPDGVQEVNPCLSYNCPSRSRCRVNLNTNLPFCACRKGTGTTVTNCTRLCKTSQECPKSEKCQFSIDKQLKMCTHVCEDHKCADHADCYVDEQRGTPKCRCKRGFQGNGNTLCERIPFKPDNDTNSYCSFSKCGPNARCRNVDGKSQCVCSPGHVGTWPDCNRACITNTDCDLQDTCTEKGMCVHVCNEYLCAPKAECKAIHRKPMCLCPAGYTGKATDACYPSHYYLSSRSGLPAAGPPPDIDFGEETTTTSEFYGDPVPLLAEMGDGEPESLKLILPTD